MADFHLTAFVEWLRDKGHNVNSQFGEDGLIAATFERHGDTNRRCFEFGAGDGKTLSNTRHLTDGGWSGLWIEHHPPLFAVLNAMKPSTVDALCETVTPDNVNELLGSLPYDTDFGVIDVDGDDYWIWKALTSINPRIMLVEYCPYLEDQKTLPPRGPKRLEQAPLEPIVELGAEKGYQLLATTFCNCLFAWSDINET